MRGRPFVAVLMGVLLASAAGAQSLYERPGPGAPASAPVTGAPASNPASAPPGPAPDGSAPPPAAGAGAMAPSSAPSIEQVSLLSVRPARPRQFQENDLVTIIVSERNQFDRNQKLDAKKDYEQTIEVSDFLDLVNLLETRFQQSTPARLPRIGVDVTNNFKGDAKYKREDKATARVTARVLEVKPNNTLVLEARSNFTTDEEEQIITLSGLCRAEDVTDKNTIQSNQMYDMNLNVQNKGQVYNTNHKGLIPRILETIFNF